MKKILIILICLLVVGGIIYTYMNQESKDFTAIYMEHASFYGLRAFAEDAYYDDTMDESYSHADFKFWGVPEYK